MNVEALKNFIIGQGASRRVITMEWYVQYVPHVLTLHYFFLFFSIFAIFSRRPPLPSFLSSFTSSSSSSVSSSFPSYSSASPYSYSTSPSSTFTYPKGQILECEQICFRRNKSTIHGRVYRRYRSLHCHQSTVIKFC